MADTLGSVSKQVQVIAGVSAALLLAGSAVFLYCSRSAANASKEKNAHLADVVDHAHQLGEVRYTDKTRKLIEKKYFVDLVGLITFHVRQEFREERAELLKRRRELFKAADREQEYEDVVREIYVKSEALFN